jgi:hypothetical protein
VDPATQPAAKTTAKPTKKAAPTVAPPEVSGLMYQPLSEFLPTKSIYQDEEKRKIREARFGASSSKTPTAAVDEEEMRKRKAREERFGVRVPSFW